jgi:hypothetical protein
LFWIADACIPHFKSHKQCILSQFMHFFPKKPYTLAGREPGSSVPQVDAMTLCHAARAVDQIIVVI